ncbi:MAG: alpha/beta fold hydrolase [Planctomycetaceae bacterium]
MWTRVAMSMLLLYQQSPQQKVDCRDSIAAPDSASESPDAIECLQGFLWKPAAFTATVTPQTPAEDDSPVAAGIDFDAEVSFPSPRPGPGGDVVLEWRKAREDNVLCTDDCPAVIVVHESGRSMAAGRTIARALCRTGVHTLLVQLPGYGRRSAGRKDSEQHLVEGLQQGVADTRRAADVARRLEGVDGNRISVLGVSLGGFVATLAGSLDDGFDQHFILMAGADLPMMFRDGQREVAQLREKTEALHSGEELLKYLRRIEPSRIAHRLPADRTVLYTAMFDVVVPPACSDRLAETIGLAPDHIIRMPCGHHSAVAFLLPMVVDVSARVTSSAK